MKNYINYLTQSIESNEISFNDLKNNNNLNNINKIIREKNHIQSLKKQGAFFTEQDLATAVVENFSTAITTDSVVLDPACGVGNLLIETSRRLGVASHLSTTLEQWGKILYGYDINPEFILITKLRLIIEALSRGVVLDCSVKQALSFFCNIKTSDAMLVTSSQVDRVTHLLINPPFIQIDSPQVFYWKKGKINFAAVFFDYYLRILPQNCEIMAILPDVLRSGSRYYLFRDFVSTKFYGKCSIWGRFSTNIDIDVFILSGKILCSDSNIQWLPSVVNKTLLSEKYDVVTGPLVAYRDKQFGDVYPYFHPRNCKNWTVITEVTESRAFNGKLIHPPCVLIKRTSSPSDKYRAAAVIVNLNQPIAVENHLIAVIPKDQTLKSCFKLLKILSKTRTNQFLNSQIRARHLTVSAIKSIPI